MVCLFFGHVVATCLLERALTGLVVSGVCFLGIVDKHALLGAAVAQCDLRACSYLVTARICSKSFACLITVTGTPIERVLDELFVCEVFFIRIFDKHVLLGASVTQCDLCTCSCLVTTHICTKSLLGLITATTL